MQRSDQTSQHRRPGWALVGAACLMSFCSLAAAEPPARAARLGSIGGTVSFSPAGQPDWVQAAVNRPLTTGDRLWTGENSRAELQMGGTAIRLGPSTSVVVLNLDDRIAQLQLSEGTLKIRVRGIDARQSFEVATPNLAFTLNRLGEYRIEVDSANDATTVMAQSGEAEVYGEGASYTIASRGLYRFYGTDLSDYDIVAARPDDDLDRWSRERDRRGDDSPSARYVSSEVVGYEDLDANGSWRLDATYGNVWSPARVANDWTPYRDGHWSWVDPWGWTWVDDAPWGYAVSHYGRWASINGSWAWVPGPRQERAVYAPALVAFVGGSNFQVSVSPGNSMPASVGWFPLAPREVYQPSYPVSRGYFDNINRSNAVIAPTTLNNVYNTTIVNTTVVNNTTNIIYANQRVTGAVVAVPTQTFQQSQPVAKATVKLAPQWLVSAPVMRFASVAPLQQSVQGGAREAVAKPPVHERAVVARTAPPPAPVAFAAQQAQLAARPGMPIDEAQRTQLKLLKPAAASTSAPKVSLVATAPAPKPTALPPAMPASGRSTQERQAAAAKADAGHAQQGRGPDAVKAAGAETANADAGKAAAASAEALKAQESKTAAVRAEAARSAQAKAEQASADAAKAETLKADAAKAEALRADAANVAAARAAAAKADEAKAERSKADAARADASKAQAARADAAKAEAAKAESATRANAARAEEAKVEAAQAAKAAATAREHAAAPPPRARGSGPRSDADASPEDEKKKEGRRP